LEQLRQLQKQIDEYIQHLEAAGTPASGRPAVAPRRFPLLTPFELSICKGEKKTGSRDFFVLTR
jgi:hypothetical protein